MTNTELLEGLARELAKSYYHKHGLETLVSVTAEQYAVEKSYQWEAQAQAALQYIQQHAKPLNALDSLLDEPDTVEAVCWEIGVSLIPAGLWSSLEVKSIHKAAKAAIATIKSLAKEKYNE